MEHKSPGFSDFRHLMDIWDEAVKQDRIEQLLDADEISFFFVHNEDIYGGDEGSRVTFARLKNPDEDSDKQWAANANFYGINLKRAAEGDKVERMFSLKDVSGVKIADKETVAKMLGKKG